MLAVMWEPHFNTNGLARNREWVAMIHSSLQYCRFCNCGAVSCAWLWGRLARVRKYAGR